MNKKETKALGVIFDMDGVLFDTEAIYQKCWHEIAEEMGIVIGDEFTKAITGTNGDYLLSVVNKFYNTENGEEITRDCLKRAYRYLEIDVPVKEGVREFLSYLKEKGIKTAIASSCHRKGIERYLEKTNLSSFIDIIVGGEEVTKCKPEPDIFLLAASRLNLNAKDCIIFEDSFNGVRAGHNSGATTIMIPDQLQPTEEIKELADAVYKSFTTFLNDAENYL